MQERFPTNLPDDPERLLACSHQPWRSCSRHPWRSISRQTRKHKVPKKQLGESAFLNTFLFNVFTSLNLLRRAEVLQAFCSVTMAVVFSAALFCSCCLNVSGWRPAERPAMLLECIPSPLRRHMYTTGKVERGGAEGGRSTSDTTLNRRPRFLVRVESGRLFISILQYSCYYN